MQQSNRTSITHKSLVCLFVLMLYVPVNKFSVMSGRVLSSWVERGYRATVSYSSTQHSACGESRTSDPSISNLTQPPSPIYQLKFHRLCACLGPRWMWKPRVHRSACHFLNWPVKLKSACSVTVTIWNLEIRRINTFHTSNNNCSDQSARISVFVRIHVWNKKI